MKANSSIGGLLFGFLLTCHGITSSQLGAALVSPAIMSFQYVLLDYTVRDPIPAKEQIMIGRKQWPGLDISCHVVAAECLVCPLAVVGGSPLPRGKHIHIVACSTESLQV
jgi:hypothetical protein